MRSYSDPVTLKSLRRSKGWTQQEAADKLGVHIGTYRKIEGERGPRYRHLAKLRQLFDLDQPRMGVDHV